MRSSTGTRLTKRTLIKFIRNAFLPILTHPSAHSTLPLVSHYKIFIRFLLYIQPKRTTLVPPSTTTTPPSLSSATDIYSNSNFSSSTTLLLLLLYHHQDQYHCSVHWAIHSSSCSISNAAKCCSQEWPSVCRVATVAINSLLG